MKQNKKFYITTTLPYVNAAPHIGFALELAQADVIARYQASLNKDVFFNTGTDEHGIKIYQKAQEQGKTPQEFVDENASKFRMLADILGVQYTNFIRTTDANHKVAAAEFWNRCVSNKNKNGEPDIYKAKYRVKYCVGCELEKTDSDLNEGRCLVHPSLTIEEREEENYFFRFSRYQKKLLELYDTHPDFVVPTHRLVEIRNFVAAGIHDFSISRLKEKMPWGISVPGDEAHVMYVWFDALINYITALGWPKDEDKFEEFWGVEGSPNAFQISGKDNLRQQSAMWQAMLMSAGLPSSRKILIHGFILSGGAKMSKTSGNVIDPAELIKKYGSDAVRYYLLREISTTEDGDYNEDKFKERYNADLANGLGNFTARVLALAAREKELLRPHDVPNVIFNEIKISRQAVTKKMEELRFNEVLVAIWELIAFGDAYMNKEEPWGIKEEGQRKKILFNLLSLLSEIAELIEPFLPTTAHKIIESMQWGEENESIKINRGPALFPRLE
ncbi:MAG: methionine--tRNA ligase [Patescibacteria group bacterium]|nr:methionine--tRNA ligase [Patescibacteria group bacterium]